MRGNTKYYRDIEGDKHFCNGKQPPTWIINRNSECFYCFLLEMGILYSNGWDNESSILSYMQVFKEYKIRVRSSEQGGTNSNLYIICSKHLLNDFMIISNWLVTQSWFVCILFCTASVTYFFSLQVHLTVKATFTMSLMFLL